MGLGRCGGRWGGAEDSGLPGAGGLRRRAGLRSWAGPGEVSDPRARTALLGPVGAGPGHGAQTGRGIGVRAGQGCGSGLGVAASRPALGRNSVCPVTQMNKHVQKGPNQCSPAMKPNLLSFRPAGISWCLCLPGPRAGQEGEGTFLLIKEVSGLGETRGYPALSVNSAISPVSDQRFPAPPAKVVPTSCSQARGAPSAFVLGPSPAMRETWQPVPRLLVPHL